MRKRTTYGTVLVDLERHRPVALLPDREAGTLATWLRAHPGVAVIARDRSGAYAKGARKGAPGVVQVADRFHLLQNLAEMLEVVFTIHAKDLRAIEQARREAIGENGSLPLPPAEAQRKVRLLAGARHERRKARHGQVWALSRRGWPREKIGSHLGISRATVYQYLRSEAFPERRTRRDAGRSRLDPWQSVVLEHWNTDRRDGRKLFGELRRLGYRGSYATLTRYLRRFRALPGGCGARRRVGQIPAGAGRGITVPGADAAHRGLDGAASGREAEHKGLGIAGRPTPVRSRAGRGNHAHREVYRSGPRSRP